MRTRDKLAAELHEAASRLVKLSLKIKNRLRAEAHEDQ